MTLRSRACACAWAIALVLLFVPSSPARAACRTITQALPAGYDPADGCFYPSSGYVPLWWSNACVGFSVQQDASKQVTWAAADATAQSAFAKWSGVQCANGADATPSIQAQDEGAVACSTVEYSEAGPNQHVLIFRDESWPYSDEYNTLALTTVTFDSVTGEILDADMEINTAQHTVVTTTPVPQGAYDLESILTHEAGHFLGLAHSPDKDAVMYALYQPGSTTLTSDDISGICSIYLPGGDRVTNQDDNGAFSAKQVAAGACNPAPLGGFGSQCGPVGAVETTKGCTVAAGAGAGGHGNDAERGAIALTSLLLALAIGRRRATLSRMKRLRALATCTLVATAAGVLSGVAAEREAKASVVISALFDEIVRDSSAAALVTPVEQRSVWQNGRVYTYTRVHVDRAVAGTLEDEPWVRTMGGIVGKVGKIVEGEAVLSVGRPGLLFMQPARDDVSGVYEVTARAQGQFPIVLDEKNNERFVRSSGVGGLVPTPQERVVQVTRMRALAGAAPGAPLATDVLHKRLVADGVHDVAAAWARIHAAPSR
jgi:hypothetical protein